MVKNRIMKTIYKIVALSVFAALFSACTLDVQDNFEFTPEFLDEDPFSNITAWEFIQSQGTVAILDDQNRKRLNGEKLDFMAAAIKRVGYEDLYNQTTTSDRTYLFLNNNAFTGNNRDRDIIRLVTGNTQGGGSLVNPDTLMASITAPDQINILKAVLRYNIVSTFVAQVPTLTIFDRDFLFKTFLPTLELDEDGTPIALTNEFADIAFRRDTRWDININNPSSPLPESALGRDFDETVRVHNIVLNNGIGHIMNDLVRFQPYPLYANFPID
ncbi:hypothetical protein DUT90_12945 [Polaribacter sp. WD7]|nr:hypothetical protein DUT90_12945 [Polaribacter sp. WD7]